VFVYTKGSSNGEPFFVYSNVRTLKDIAKEANHLKTRFNGSLNSFGQPIGDPIETALQRSRFLAEIQHLQDEAIRLIKVGHLYRFRDGFRDAAGNTFYTSYLWKVDSLYKYDKKVSLKRHGDVLVEHDLISILGILISVNVLDLVEVEEEEEVMLNELVDLGF